jgi:hypothetical protein
LKEVQVEVDVSPDEIVETQKKAAPSVQSKSTSSAATNIVETMKKKQQNAKSASKGKQGSMLDFFKKQ